MSQEDVILSQDPCTLMSMSQNLSGVQMSQLSQSIGGVQMSQSQSGLPLSQLPQNLNGLQMSQNAGSLRYFTTNVAGPFQGTGNQCMQGLNNPSNCQMNGNQTLQAHADRPNYERPGNHMFQPTQCFVGNGSNQVFQDNGNQSFQVSRKPMFTKDLLGCHDLSKN